MPPHKRTYARNAGCSQPCEADIDVARDINESFFTGSCDDVQKRKRGPTYMCTIWGYHASQHGGERIVINFNRYGQPIGKNKSLFVEFLGTIARNGKHAPLDIKSWDKMPKSLKRIMLDDVKEKFEIPASCHVWVIQSIGKKWRNWKADVKSKSYNPKLSIEEQLCNVPKRVLKDQWKNLLHFWNSEEAKLVSEQNQKSRGNKTLMHTTGKRSFGQIREIEEKNIGRSPTRVEMFEKCYTKDGIPSNTKAGDALDKMKELRSQSSQLEDVGRDDIFSKVLGNEKIGRVRMFGLGVTPYDAWGEIPSRNNAYRITEGYKEAFEKMEKQIYEQGEVIAQLKVDMQNRQQTHHNTPSRVDQSSSNGNLNAIDNSATIRVGAKVALKSIIDPSKIVAIGYIQSLDPTHIVGNYPLGPNWCSIHINIPLDWEEHLIRPYSTLETIGQAIGTYIAWPQAFVVREED